MRHLILAGDSIFDNDGYVLGEPGVIEQLRKALPTDWSCTKTAVDGDCIANIEEQINVLPSNATDLIVSVGGNDARYHSALLKQVRSHKGLIERLERPLEEFRKTYQKMLNRLKETGLRLHVCTIYTAIPFEDPVWRQYVPLAITHFNEIIIKEATERGISIFRLEKICTEESDFSSVSPIEPSSKGGQKIVDHIVDSLE